VTALPAAPATLVAYVDAQGKRLKPGTIRRQLCSLRKIHLINNLSDPTDGEEVALAVRRIRRSQPSRPRQAHGITADLRDRLLAACSNDMIGLRDKTVISVGFDLLCRGGELVALCAEDLAPTSDGRFLVLVRRAKNDPDGAGRTGRLSKATSDIVTEWMTSAEINRGPLIRPVFRSRILHVHMHPLAVSRIVKKLCDRTGVDTELVKKVSSHSLRVGAAQQLTLNGFGLPQIMRAGGWKSTSVVARYIENVDLDFWS
jgi:integrase